MFNNRTLFLISCLVSLPLIAKTEAEFLAQFIKPGDLVFDVGANIGKKTKLYLSLGARVLAIEPQPDCCARLRAEFTGKPIFIVEMGLASKPGKCKLGLCAQADTIASFSTEWQTMSRFSGKGFTWDKQIDVEMTTLQNLINQFGLPQFCKIDVENFEYEVLLGLKQPIQYISFEYAIETIHNTLKCLEYLCNLGYKEFNFAIADHPCLILETWSDAEAITQKLMEYNSMPNNGSSGGLWGDIYARY